MEVQPYSFFWWFGGYWVSFTTTDELLVGVTKNYFKGMCLMNSQPAFLFFTYLILMNYDHIIKSV